MAARLLWAKSAKRVYSERSQSFVLVIESQDEFAEAFRQLDHALNRDRVNDEIPDLRHISHFLAGSQLPIDEHHSVTGGILDHHVLLDVYRFLEDYAADLKSTGEIDKAIAVEKKSLALVQQLTASSKRTQYDGLMYSLLSSVYTRLDDLAGQSLTISDEERQTIHNDLWDAKVRARLFLSTWSDAYKELEPVETEKEPMLQMAVTYFVLALPSIVVPLLLCSFTFLVFTFRWSKDQLPTLTWATHSLLFAFAFGFAVAFVVLKFIHSDILRLMIACIPVCFFVGIIGWALMRWRPAITIRSVTAAVVLLAIIGGGLVAVEPLYQIVFANLEYLEFDLHDFSIGFPESGSLELYVDTTNLSTYNSAPQILEIAWLGVVIWACLATILQLIMVRRSNRLSEFSSRTRKSLWVVAVCLRNLHGTCLTMGILLLLMLLALTPSVLLNVEAEFLAAEDDTLWESVELRARELLDEALADKTRLARLRAQIEWEHGIIE